MVQVIWTRQALSDLRSIRTYIGQVAPLAALRTAMRLNTAAASLSAFPERGRASSGATRELATIRPYLIRYRVEGETVFILRIRHGAQEPD